MVKMVTYSLSPSQIAAIEQVNNLFPYLILICLILEYIIIFSIIRYLVTDTSLIRRKKGGKNNGDS